MRNNYAFLFSVAIITLVAVGLGEHFGLGRQLGEVAGQPTFNMTLGSTNTIAITVVNQAPYPYPLPVIVLLPASHQERRSHGSDSNCLAHG